MDAYLGSNGVWSGREELCNTGSVETSFSKTESSTKTSTTSTDDNSIVFVVNDGVFAGNWALEDQKESQWQEEQYIRKWKDTVQ